jgi:hypothetical protein
MTCDTTSDSLELKKISTVYVLNNLSKKVQEEGKKPSWVMLGEPKITWWWWSCHAYCVQKSQSHILAFTFG